MTDNGDTSTAERVNTPPRSELVVQHSQLSVYDKITDLADFVEGLGKYIFESQIFKCTPAAGRVLALECVVRKQPPLLLAQTYHFISGTLSMRADAMLAGFRRLDGDHKIISRTPDKAAIELSAGRKKMIFELAWSDIWDEEYVYSNAANDKPPRIAKRLPDGTINPAALKDNWSTPRRRMQMLWARCVSDAVRAFAPEVNAGSYTPEESGEIADDGAVDVEFSPAKEKGTATVFQGHVAKQEAAPFVVPAAQEAEVSAPASNPPAPAVPTEAAKEPAKSGEQIKADADKENQLHLLRQLKDCLSDPDVALTKEQYNVVLQKNYAVDSAMKLSLEQLTKLVDGLKKRVVGNREKKSFS